VEKGFKEAASAFPDLQADYFNVPPGKTQDALALLDLFESAVAARYDAIIFPINHATMFDEPVQKAVDKGIIVIASNIDDPEGEKGNARHAFVGEDIKLMHYLASIADAKKMGIKPGDHVLLTNEYPGAGWAESQLAGHKQYCDEMGIEYDLIVSTADVAEGEAIAHSYLLANPQTKAIWSGGWPFSLGAVNALKALGYKPGEMAVVIRDASEPVLEQFFAGYVSTVSVLSQYQHGYYPVVIAYQHLKFDYPLTTILMPSRFIQTEEQANKAIELAKQGYL
jgi:simple sugar transport system substrate-binding protein